MVVIEIGQYYKEKYFRGDTRIIQVVAIRNEFIRVKTLIRIPGKSLSKGCVTWISWNRFVDNFVQI